MTLSRNSTLVEFDLVCIQRSLVPLLKFFIYDILTDKNTIHIIGREHFIVVKSAGDVCSGRMLLTQRSSRQ